MLIRNDDIAADTKLAEIKRFCSICDEYGVDIIHAITPRGAVRGIDCRWSNEHIVQSSLAMFADNKPVIEYLLSREDGIAVHGLYHTHRPSLNELLYAKSELESVGLKPTHYVPPFNEGSFHMPCFDHLGPCPRLEEFLLAGDPQSDLVYLHSWRFEYGPFHWRQLETCLQRLTRQS